MEKGLQVKREGRPWHWTLEDDEQSFEGLSGCCGLEMSILVFGRKLLLPTTKYGVCRDEWDPQLPNPRHSSLWRGILPVKHAIDSLIWYQVGSSERIHFWLDTWGDQLHEILSSLISLDVLCMDQPGSARSYPSSRTISLGSHFLQEFIIGWGPILFFVNHFR